MMPMVIASLMSVHSSQWTVHSLVYSYGVYSSAGYRFYIQPAVFLSNDPRGNGWIVFEEHDVLALDGFGDEGALELERFHRIEIVGHDPRHVDVRGGREQIRGEHGRLPGRLDVDDLVEPRVAAGPLHANARRDGLVVGRQIEHARLLQRHVVLGEVAGPIPLVRMHRILPLAGVHEIARVREAGANRSGGVARGEPAGVIEMEVRGED